MHNRFKVGPNYQPPAAAVASTWIDGNDRRVRMEKPDLSNWWCAFQDPILNSLISRAYEQNLTVKSAAARVLEARAQRAIAVGNFFPQVQQAGAGYQHVELSRLTKNANLFNTRYRFFDQWDGGFNLAWELDVWGRYRRAIESADANLEAMAENYDAVLVTLVADVASNYVVFRTTQKRLDAVRRNVENQKYVMDILENRFKQAAKNAEFDYPQHKAQYEYTKSLLANLEIELRQAANQMCILLGMPPQALLEQLGSSQIPYVPNPGDQTEWDASVVVGIPGESLLRRPDVRRAERELASQCAKIGVATAELYPHIAVTGTIGLEAANFRDLYNSKAWAASIGPSLAWNILNYGRILNNIRAQDALFQQLGADYQQAVLVANREAEDAMISFLQSQKRFSDVSDAAKDADLANTRFRSSFETGREVDFNQWFNVARLKRDQDELVVQVKGDIALSLIQLYRALGGGWQIRQGANCEGSQCAPQATTPAVSSVTPTVLRRPSRQEFRIEHPPALPAATPTPAGTATPAATIIPAATLTPAAAPNSIQPKLGRPSVVESNSPSADSLERTTRVGGQ